jgi:hypothetical protein
MGCDIHAHVEIKVADQWLYYGQANIPRHYSLFARMAGVRSNGEINPIAAPRGFPKEDVITHTTLLHFKRWASDAHSVSWLSSTEVALVLEEFGIGQEWRSDRCHFCDNWGYLFGGSFSGFVKYPQDRPEWLQDFRLVFWFDN